MMEGISSYQIWHDREVLLYLYHGKEMSMSEIADRLGCTSTTICDWMDRHDVRSRSFSKANQLRDEEIYSRGDGHPMYGVTGEDHPRYGIETSEETARLIVENQSHR